MSGPQHIGEITSGLLITIAENCLYYHRRRALDSHLSKKERDEARNEAEAFRLRLKEMGVAHA